MPRNTVWILPKKALSGGMGLFPPPEQLNLLRRPFSLNGPAPHTETGRSARGGVVAPAP